MKKVLFIQPWLHTVTSYTPHVGLGMLASVLRKAGHEVLVLDMVIDKTPVAEVMKAFDPDMVGITLYTSIVREAYRIADEVLSIKKIPLLAGGPHTKFYYNELIRDGKFNYILQGEAEESIVEVVERAQIQEPEVITCPLPDVTTLPLPDFTAFHNYKNIEAYPLLTSRGCPFECSFCEVYALTSRKWRYRPTEQCIEEVKIAKKTYPHLWKIDIPDDCPTGSIRHFKEFLIKYLESGINIQLVVSNLRADRIDEEVLGLLKKVGADSVCIAAEHGHPEVFNMINKGETLDEIKASARMIKKAGLRLGMCFIIGLPGDSLERMQYSVNLARELKVDFCYWNMIIPHKGTRVRDWFEKNGVLYDEIGITSIKGHSFMCDDPVVETKDFTREERKQAFFLAALRTNSYRIKLTEIPALLRYVHKYGYYKYLAESLYLKVKSVPFLIKKFFEIIQRPSFWQITARRVRY